MDSMDTYLGDGVYASFDGFAIKLDMRAQDNTTVIVLAPNVMKALTKYVEAIRATHGETCPL